MDHTQQYPIKDLPPAPVPASVHSGAEPQESSRFILSETCLLILSRGDITKWCADQKPDAIVNSTNRNLSQGGGVDRAIHNAAGSDLLKACEEIPEVQRGIRCPVGSARITSGFQLPVSHIIHTVGPIYSNAKHPESLLSDAYRSCLDVAREKKVKYIAFPAIACGMYKFPYEKAAEVSLTTVRDSAKDFEEVHFILFEEPAWKAWMERANELFEQL